ncbi:MAG: NAD(P)H-dependent oxidoreductase subunit E [Bacteroidales bacterium]|nr:NAD(P)H-dependent oxidoreductase subunit E [Bacteroidales bacterium]
MSKNKIIEKYKPVKHNLLPILHELQDSNPQNYITEDDVIMVSKHLNISFAEVYGLIGYYSMLSNKPRGKYIIRICNSPVCNMIGSENIAELLCSELNIGIGETTTDKLFTLEYSECLGHCDIAPVMIINKEIFGNLNKQKIEEIIENLRNK